MKKENRIVFSVIGILVLVALVTAVSPSPAATAQRTGNELAAGQTLTATGKISAFDKHSFTIAIGTSTMAQESQQAAPKTMNFLIDKNTTVDGKMQVGANADVTYREDNGTYVAISVRVS